MLAKLLAEIEAVEEIDFTTVMTKMPYLDAIIMEINRLYPSVPATLRVIERETRLRTCKKPVVLKPGMLIYLSYLHMHTSPKHWGPDAGDFDPKRFLHGIDKSKPFMAFGSGTRDCVSIMLENLWAMLTVAGRIQVRPAGRQGVSHHAAEDVPLQGRGKQLHAQAEHSARDLRACEGRVLPADVRRLLRFAIAKQDRAWSARV